MQKINTKTWQKNKKKRKGTIKETDVIDLNIILI